MNALSVLVVALSAAALGGCATGSSAVPGPRSEAPLELTGDQEIAVRKVINDNEGWTLAIHQDVATICPDVKTPSPSPDTAWVNAQWRGAILGLAQCMQTGQLKNDDITVVGHASRRGWDSYHLSVGMTRADRLREALSALGVDESRVHVVTHREGVVDEDAPLERPADTKVEVGLKPPSLVTSQR